MSADREEIRELVRRVVGSVLAERGNRAWKERPLRGGVHVSIAPGGEPVRPAAGASGPSHEGRGLVTARCLRDVPDGGRFSVPSRSVVTALARDEAWSRGIELVHEDRAPRSDRVRVAVAADHGGFALKREVVAWLREAGYTVEDLGTHGEEAVDYPDFALAVAETVARGHCDVGVCVDGAGIGSAMAANKVPGVRAANCYDEKTARNAREHNLANVLTLGGRMLAADDARRVLFAFLRTPHGGDRHARRVAKITSIEQRYARRPHGESVR